MAPTHNRTRHALPAHALVTLATVALLSACNGPPSDEMAPVTRRADLRIEDLKRTVGIVRDKFTSLAAAMPESSLSWRPMDGVRSVSDVYIHISADNYYVPSLMGIEAPEATGVTDDIDTFRAYQERSMSRTEMLAAVDESFEFFLDAIDLTAGELDREITLGAPTTVGDVWIRAVTHLHEHLGQSIAYARSNGVVPPWSR